MINELGIGLIKHFEALRLEAYQDCGQGIWTIFWGHTGPDVYPGLIGTKEQADQWLLYDLAIAEQAVFDCVTIQLNSNQLSALVSFVFNLGARRLKKSTLLKKLNAGDYFGASKEFRRWIYVKDKKLKKSRRARGLLRRRLSERNLFCGFPGPIVALDSAQLKDAWST